MGSKYVPLARLVEEWARRGGELPATVLTNLCEHVARGRFPAEAFRHSGSGEPAKLSELLGLVQSSGYRVLREDATRTLRAIVVSKAHVRQFCRANAIKPPRCVVGFVAWLSWRGARHRSPPPEPTPEELEQREAARLAADAAWNNELAYEAEAHMDLLRSMLSRSSGEDPSPGDPSGSPAPRATAHGGAVEATELRAFPRERFDRSASRARNCLEQLTDADRAAELRGRLEELEAQATAVQEQSQARPPVVNTEPPGAAAQYLTTSVAETRCRRWLAEMMRAGSPGKAKAEYRAEAQQRFPGIGARGFVRSWDAAINETGNIDWRRPGRKS